MGFVYGTPEWEKAFKGLAEKRLGSESEPYLIGSPEWILSFERALQGDKKYRDAAKKWEGTVVIHMIGDAKAGIPEDLYVHLDLWHGDCRSVRLVPAETGKNGDYVLTAELDKWQSVLKGELNAVKGMMKGQIKIKGNLAKMVRFAKAANRLVEVTAEVKAKFPNELNEEEFAKMQSLLNDIRPKFGV